LLHPVTGHPPSGDRWTGDDPKADVPCSPRPIVYLPPQSRVHPSPLPLGVGSNLNIHLSGDNPARKSDSHGRAEALTTGPSPSAVHQDGDCSSKRTTVASRYHDQASPGVFFAGNSSRVCRNDCGSCTASRTTTPDQLLITAVHVDFITDALVIKGQGFDSGYDLGLGIGTSTSRLPAQMTCSPSLKGTHLRAPARQGAFFPHVREMYRRVPATRPLAEPRSSGRALRG
jgi:hypothetical protein